MDRLGWLEVARIETLRDELSSFVSLFSHFPLDVVFISGLQADFTRLDPQSLLQLMYIWSEGSLDKSAFRFY